MDERIEKVLKMDYIKEEWLVLEIAEAELATINTKTVLDESVVHGVMRMISCLFIAGAILVMVGIVVGLTVPSIPVWGDPEESSSPATTPFGIGIMAFGIGTFYLIFLMIRRNVRTNIVANKAKGTITVQERFGNRENRRKRTLNIVDVIQVECQKREVTDEEGPNHFETDVFARDKQDQLTKLTWFDGELPLENFLLHFNAWLHGDEVGPAAYQDPL